MVAGVVIGGVIGSTGGAVVVVRRLLPDVVAGVLVIVSGVLAALPAGAGAGMLSRGDGDARLVWAGWLD